MHIHISTVRDLGDFVYFVRELANDDEFKGDVGLDVYLPALWGLILKHKAIAPSWTLFAYLIEEAFFADPVPFDAAWMVYEHPPKLDEETFQQPFETLRKMILYQIADWRRMQAVGTFDLPPSMLYVGVTSPAGNIWYNFDTRSFLDRGAGPWDDSVHRTDCEWYELAILLWLGQTYE